MVAVVRSRSFPYHAGRMKSKLIVALDADSFQEAATQVPATRDVVDDQRRTMTPAEAIIARANYVVV